MVTCDTQRAAELQQLQLRWSGGKPELDATRPQALSPRLELCTRTQRPRLASRSCESVSPTLKVKDPKPRAPKALIRSSVWVEEPQPL